MAAVWNDVRVAAGIRRQLTALDALESDGADLVGWKLGLGAPAVREQAGLAAPVVGYLTSRTVVADGTRVPVERWAKPAVEAELAVWLDADVEPGASDESARAAIAGIGPAIELADVDRPLGDVEDVVAGNVFHRAVILGPVDRTRAGGDTEGISVRVTRDQATAAATDDPTELTGSPAALVAHVAAWVGAAGRRLRAGEVIIAGAVVPLLFAQAGETFVYDCHPLGHLSVHLV